VSLTASDLFCGAGGSSLGAEIAGVELKLALNHWRVAIETHAQNFPNADHDCEDISSLTTAQIRRYPDTDILLASPECTNHSLAKGALRRKPEQGSLFDDGPAGTDEQDRSRATMWDVCRFAEQKILKGKPYKAIVVENVPDVIRWGANDDGGLFSAWRSAMNALGYDSEIVWLNSMFCPPTPQSRDRAYVVFWQKGIPRPNLQLEPPSWCPHCEKIVHGRQAWKKPGPTPWARGARYGPQYIYVCPDCNKPAIPGAFPAASAIDWSIPAPAIGEREALGKKALAEKTRERIRRGLERLSTEPFAIRLLHSGTPKPLTLPFATVTQRHDLAVVLPTAAGTFERTPGNRARNPDVRPFDTVHGTFHQALVIPLRKHTKAAKADEEPVHSMTAGGFQHAVLHYTGTEARRTSEPIGTVTARGNHHAVLVSNYGPGGGNKDPDKVGGWVRDTEHDQFGTITATDGHGLVVPYDRTGVPRSTDEPTPTATTHDRLALCVPETLHPDAYDQPAREYSDAEIDACGFRMFDLHEIAEVMVMRHHHTGDEYVVTGNKRQRMAQYGNAVTPPAMTFLVNRLAEALN
jgi:DNA (cytosine-5)-methyltransferase 1